MNTDCDTRSPSVLGEDILRALYPIDLATNLLRTTDELATDTAIDTLEAPEAPDDPDQPHTLCHLGVLAYRHRHYERAEHCFDRARLLTQQRLGPHHPHIATLLNNLGVVASARGDDTAARRHYEAALALKVEAHGWDDASVAATVLNLGRLAERVGDLRSALAHYAQARATFELREGPTGPGLAAALIAHGRAQMRRGALHDAIRDLERAHQIREATPTSTAQRSAARFFLAVAIQHLDPHRARALVLRALDDHRALGPEPTDDRRALEAWLTWHDARNPPRP